MEKRNTRTYKSLLRKLSQLDVQSKQSKAKPSSARYSLRYAFAEQFIETRAGREPASCKSAESEPYNIAYKALSAI